MEALSLRGIESLVESVSRLAARDRLEEAGGVRAAFHADKKEWKKYSDGLVRAASPPREAAPKKVSQVGLEAFRKK